MRCFMIENELVIHKLVKMTAESYAQGFETICNFVKYIIAKNKNKNIFC